MASSSGQCVGCGVVVETGVDEVIVVVMCRCESVRDADEVDNELDVVVYARPERRYYNPFVSVFAWRWSRCC